MENNRLEYKEFYAIFKNSVINVYNTDDSLIHTKSYSVIIDIHELEKHFHKIVDNYIND